MTLLRTINLLYDGRLKESVITLSGSVTVSSVGVIRDIIVYKKGQWDVPHITKSISDGTWTIDINCSSLDELMVICLGEAGENSQIYSHIVG